MLRALLPALLVVGCATTPSASSSPAMADLRALDQQQNYAEMLGRLKDVPPAQRDAEWEALTEKANVAALEKVEITDGRSGEYALMAIEDQLAAFPSLKKSPAYLQNRADVGVKAFGWTYSNYRHSTGDEQWVPKVKKFAEADSATKGLAQRIAKDVILGRLVASSAWPLYELAFQRDGDAVCADPKLIDVVIDVIDYESWLDEMTTLVTKRCSTQLKTPVAEKLKKNDSKSFRKGACQVLAGQAGIADALKVCEG
jgi:hypothetical protein